jgi:type VI secretion system protein VasG
MALGLEHGERLTSIAAQRATTESQLTALKDRWDRESELVARIRAVRERIENLVTAETPSSGNGAAAGGEQSGAASAQTAAADAQGAAAGAQGPNAAAEQPTAANANASQEGNGATEPVQPASMQTLRAELVDLTGQLERLQGDSPLIPVTVDGQLVGQVIAGWTGIPVGKMLRDDVAMALQLESYLEARIIGQNHALEIISHRIRTSKAGIEDPSKPVGVFLLVGPSGVGKTETALTLSDLLFGGEQNLITINMSEFQEAHTVSTLKGAPPGYVGYGEGGVLTEAVRRRPYSVVLLDEIEKAHPDVLELFFQVFDKGRMEDGEGRAIDFKNCIIVLTTNAGTDTIMKLTADPDTMPAQEGLVKALKPELDKTFKPAFLGRTVIIPYFPVRDEALKRIIRLKLSKVQRRLLNTHRVELLADETVIDAISQRCTEVESGARNVDNILTNTLLPALSRLMLHSLVEGNRPAAIRVGIGEDGEFTYNAEQAPAEAASVEPATEAVPA